MLKFNKIEAGYYVAYSVVHTTSLVVVYKVGRKWFTLNYKDIETQHDTMKAAIAAANESEEKMKAEEAQKNAPQDAPQSANSNGTVTVSNGVATLSLEASTGLSGWYMMALAVSHSHPSVDRVVIDHNGFKAYYEVIKGDNSVEYVPPYSLRHPHKCGGKGWS